jgi:hypothetical protein
MPLDTLYIPRDIHFFGDNMKENKNKKIAVGIVFLFLSAGILHATSASENNFVEKRTDERILIKFETITPDQEHRSNRCLLKPNTNNIKYSTLENSIYIPSEIAEKLVEELEHLKEKIENSESEGDTIDYYSNCLQLLHEYNILPESFSIESLIITIDELTKIMYENMNIFPKIMQKHLWNYQKNFNIREESKLSPESNNNVNVGETRLDIGSAFFILNVLSIMTPWNIVPNPPGIGDVIEINITDLTIGKAFVEMFPGSENYTFLLGWVAGVSYAYLYSIPGNSLIGGQALFSWPKAIPMYTYIYSGASIIIPIGLLYGSLTIMLDRGPRQVPIPLFEAAVIASILTVHMPYARDPNQ